MKYQQFTETLKSLFVELLPYYIGNAEDEIGTKVKPADGTPVTSLDHYTLERLRGVVAADFPDDLTIGEEDQKNPEEINRILARRDECQWTVDGLDGTGNLLLGTNCYGAAISRRRGDTILYAASFLPVDQKLRGNGFLFAEHARGAWEWRETRKDYVRLHTAPQGKLKRITVMLEGGSKKFFKPPISLVGLAETMRPSVSSCVAGAAVARGKASALVTIENKPWDNWPNVLMIQEAGGIVTDFRGYPCLPENCGNMVAAANNADHAQIVELLNSPPDSIPLDVLHTIRRGGGGCGSAYEG